MSSIVIYEITNYISTHIFISLQKWIIQHVFVCLSYDCLTIICHYWICYLFIFTIFVWMPRWMKIYQPICRWLKLTLILQNDNSHVSHKFILYQLSIVLFDHFVIIKSFLLWCNHKNIATSSFIQQFLL